MWAVRSRQVASTAAAGTIIPTARGGPRLATHSASDPAPVAPYDLFPYGGGQSAATSATLLLPTTVWDTNYIAVDAFRKSQIAAEAQPSIDIVAAEDGTTVTISGVSRWLWWLGTKINAGEGSSRRRSDRRSIPATSGLATSLTPSRSGPSVISMRAVRAAALRAQSVSKSAPSAAGPCAATTPRGTAGRKRREGGRRELLESLPIVVRVVNADDETLGEPAHWMMTDRAASGEAMNAVAVVIERLRNRWRDVRIEALRTRHREDQRMPELGAEV